MITQRQKAEHLVAIYNTIALDEWDRNITITVPNNHLVTALLWALNDNGSGIMSGAVYNSGNLKVGDKITIRVTTPETSFLRILDNIDALVEGFATSTPQDFFYIKSEYFFSGDNAETSIWFKNYIKIISFIGAIKKVCLFSQENPDKIILAQQNVKFDMPIIYDTDAIKNFNFDDLNHIIRFLAPNSIHNEQKKVIFSDAIIDLTKHLPSKNRFLYLINNLSSINENILYAYNLFCADFSYEKFKEDLSSSRLDAFTKAHKIFSDIQNQILGIPAATFIVTTQMKATESFDQIFWANTGILIGCLIYCILMLITLHNQEQTLQVIEQESQVQKSKLLKQLAIDDGVLPSEINNLYKPLDNRIEIQKHVLFFLQLLISSGIFICLAIYLKLSY